LKDGGGGLRGTMKVTRQGASFELAAGFIITLLTPPQPPGNMAGEWEISAYSNRGFGGWEAIGRLTTKLPLSDGANNIKVSKIKVAANPANLTFQATWAFVSRWTPGQFTQYHFRRDKPDHAPEQLKLQLFPDADGGASVGVVAPSGPLALPGSAWVKENWGAPNQGLFYRVFLNARVYDASGTLSSETMIALLESTKDSGWLRLLPVAGTPSMPLPDQLRRLASQSRLRARITVWQAAPYVTSPAYQSWLDPMFPMSDERSGPAEREARYRIVHVEPPITEIA